VADLFWGIVGCACIIIGVVMLMNETKGTNQKSECDMKQRKILQHP